MGVSPVLEYGGRAGTPGAPLASTDSVEGVGGDHGRSSVADQVPAFHGGGIGRIDVHDAAGSAAHRAAGGASGNPARPAEFRFRIPQLSETEGSYARALGGAAGRPAECAGADDYARSGNHPGRIAGSVAPGGQRLAAAGRFFRKGNGAAGHSAGDYGSRGTGLLSAGGVARRDATLVVRRRTPLRGFTPGYLFLSSERS